LGIGFGIIFSLSIKGLKILGVLFVQLVEKAARSQFNPSKLISRVSTTKKTMAKDSLVIDEFYFCFAPQ
jgi:hypothetical protein